MKKKRLAIMIFVLIFLCVMLSLSSTLFQLQYVKIKFDGEYDDKLSSSENIDKIISSVYFKYGQLLFTQSKTQYICDLEKKNPNLCVKSIQAVFPNTLLITLEERVGCFYLVEDNKTFVLDREFKILEIGQNLDTTGCIKLDFLSSSNVQQTYFDFFEISSFAYDVGQFLTENNLIFASISCFSSVFDNFSTLNFTPSKIVFKNNLQDKVSLNVFSLSPFGIKIEINNILNNFEKKLKKSLSALSTLYSKERIKTTYGRLLVNDNCNCYWYEK